MRANLIVALAVAAMALAPSPARAMPNHCFPGYAPGNPSYQTFTMASIGDSMSQGVDAWDDGCHTISDYVGRLGSDWNGSWAVGDATTTAHGSGYSVKSRLAYNGAKPWIAFQKNGAYIRESAEADALNLSSIMGGPMIAPHTGNMWVNGPAQAQSIVNNCVQSGNYLGAPNCPQVVTIEMGGNDVCKSGPTPVWDSNATTQSYIDQTAAILGQLPYGTEVWVNLMPNIESYRAAAAGKRNWAFATCQDLWNLDTSKITLDAKVCDVWLVCDILDTLKEWVAEVVSMFLPILQDVLQAVFGLNTTSVYPCWSQINSMNTSFRPTGQAKNTFINNYLVSKFCYAGTNNPTYCRDYGTWYGNAHFFLATSLPNLTFNDKQISTLDCFHPSRSGQELLATMFYNDLCSGGTQPPNCAGPAPTTTRSLSYVWHPNQGKYVNQFSMQTTCAKSQVCIYLRQYNAIGTSSGVNYQKICEQQFADTHNVQFNVAVPGYYWLAWEITDLGGWRYPTAGYPPEVYGGSYYYLY